MKAALHDAEKEHFKHKIFPNLALMKTSTYHKEIGDQVEWWNLKIGERVPNLRIDDSGEQLRFA